MNPRRPICAIVSALSTAALLVLTSATAAWAQAPSPTCVEVVTARGDAAGLLRLVRDEVDRHPSHRAVELGQTPASEAGDDVCPTHLRVELIEVREGRFLTARINDAVPHRERVDGDDTRALGTALERALTVVLHNDPVRLRGPNRENWLSRKGGDLRRHGQNLFGAELYQSTAWVDGGINTLPGLALVARREIDDWYLGIRLAGAWEPGDAVYDTAHLSLVASGGLEVAYFLDALADDSFFFGGLVGLDVQRVTGPAKFLEAGDRGAANKVLLTLGGRAGYEMFRTTDTRVNFFAHMTLPVMPTRDKDTGVIDQWVPSAGLGVGAAF